MEPILAFSYYLGMREQLNSCPNPLAGDKYQLFAQADRRQPITTDVPTEYPVGVVQCLAAQDTGSPEKLISLNNAETINFDRPMFSAPYRIKAGLIQSAVGLALFVGLMLAESYFFVAGGHFDFTMGPNPNDGWINGFSGLDLVKLCPLKISQLTVRTQDFHVPDIGTNPCSKISYSTSNLGVTHW